MVDHGRKSTPRGKDANVWHLPGAAGGDQGLLTGPADDFERVDASLGALQGGAKRFIVRCYDSFQDPGSPLWGTPSAPKDFGRYAQPSRTGPLRALENRSLFTVRAARRRDSQPQQRKRPVFRSLEL